MLWLAILTTLKGVLSSVLKFLWEYKTLVVIGLLIGVCFGLYGEVKKQQLAHLETISNHQQGVDSLEQQYLSAIIAQQQEGLRIQQEAINKYFELNETLNQLQERYDAKDKEVSDMANTINTNVSGLQQQIRSYSTVTNSNGSNGNNSKYAKRLSVLGEVSGECSERYGEVATEASKLSNSVTTLQEAWKEVQQKYHRVDSFTDDVSKEVTKQQLKHD